MRKTRMNGWFCTFSIMNLLSPDSGSTDDEKDEFYVQLERKYTRCQGYEVVMRKFQCSGSPGEEIQMMIGQFRFTVFDAKVKSILR